MVNVPLREFLTTHKISERYAVDLAPITCYAIWCDRLKLWRDTEALVEKHQWVLRKDHRKGRRSYIYDEPCVLFLVRRDIRCDWFCEMVYEAHAEAIVNVLRGAVAEKRNALI